VTPLSHHRHTAEPAHACCTDSDAVLLNRRAIELNALTHGHFSESFTLDGTEMRKRVHPSGSLGDTIAPATGT